MSVDSPAHGPQRNLAHGAIGNGRVVGLVSPAASIDWLCLPELASPSVFGRLLDTQRGGSFRILSGAGETGGTSSYVPSTNVLRTTCEAGDAAWEVLDFAPFSAEIPARPPAEIVRVVRPLRGRPRLRFDLDARPGYAQTAPRCTLGEGRVTWETPSGALVLWTDASPSDVVERREVDLVRPLHFALAFGAAPATSSGSAAEQALDRTAAAWRIWTAACKTPGFADEAVLRSTLCLGLLADPRTGAIAAAATTSVPEALGTPRTWDYRYCWIRDGAFAALALHRVGRREQARNFARFLAEAARAGPLRPLYGMQGDTDLEEKILPHLSGFRGTGPVRFGNAASGQRQNDLFGEIVLCLDAVVDAPHASADDAAELLPLLETVVAQARAVAATADAGLWELRGIARHHTFSRAMCWAALAHGASLARRMGRPDLAEAWESDARAERQIVLSRGYSESLGTFTQELDGREPDASLLLLPSIGVLDGRDPRMVRTLDACEALLVRDGFVRRYRNPDDFGTSPSAFLACSFWYAQALALAGRVDQAEQAFARACAVANPVGLFSEDVDPSSGELWGNFPQAYCHAGLIQAAMAIAEARRGPLAPEGR